MESKLFSPVTFGPLTLRNRTIRSAAFESMCPENTPTQMLLDYHRSVAAGGVGMTTVAYAAVTQSGLLSTVSCGCVRPLFPVYTN